MVVMDSYLYFFVEEKPRRMIKNNGVLVGSLRAQTSFFILIGLTVLLVLGATIYVVNKQNEAVINSVPLNVRPVYDFVKSCIEQVGKDVVVVMGQQGGYYSIPRGVEVEPSSYIFQDPGKILKVPLWYHRGEDRSPSVVEMQLDMERNVKLNLDSCLNDFVGLESFGVKRGGDISVQSILGEENVILKVSMPLSLELLDGTPSIDVFEAVLPVRLKSILSTARDIHNSENENKQFEKMVVGLLSANPNTPVNGLDFSCDTKQWSVKGVESEIKSMMQLLLPRVRIKNTVVTPFEDDSSKYRKLDDFSLGDIPRIAEEDLTSGVPLDSYDYSHLFLDMGVLSKQPVSVSFQYYPDCGLDFVVNPNDGGLLKSQRKSAIPKLDFLCVNTYHFAYTFRLPILVTLRDDSAFHGEGFSFNFGTPILVKNNVGERDPSPWKSFSGYVEDESFCKERGDEKVIIRGLGNEEGLGVSTPLRGVNVSYDCFGRVCNLGSTDNDGSGASQLDVALPSACSNPTITLSKDGYLSRSEQLDSGQDRLELVMQAIKPYNLRVVKQPFYRDNVDGAKWGPVEPLGVYDNVTLSLSHPDFTQYISYPSEKLINLAEGSQMYDLSVYLTTFGTLVGGYANNEWSVKSSEIDGSDTVTITVVKYNPSTDEEGIASVLNDVKVSEDLRPVIS